MTTLAGEPQISHVKIMAEDYLFGLLGLEGDIPSSDPPEDRACQEDSAA